MTSKKALRALVSQLAHDSGLSLALSDETITGEGRTRFVVCHVIGLNSGFDQINYPYNYRANELEQTLRFTLDIIRMKKEAFK